MRVQGFSFNKRKWYRHPEIALDVRPIRVDPNTGMVLVFRKGDRVGAIATWVFPNLLTEVSA